MTDEKNGGFCMSCGLRIESFEGLSVCPHCESTDIPAGDSQQVTVSVNWHELHILCVWAENHANKSDGKLTSIVYGIAHRLENQYPEKHKLTLAGEVSLLKRKYPELETNIPGVE